LYTGNRRVILGQLGNRYRRRFDTHWLAIEKMANHPSKGA
jgi:hypothetical protein